METFSKTPSRRHRECVVLTICLFFCLRLSGESRTVKVGVFPASPLVLIKDGKPEGLFIELIEYFSRSLGWKLQYLPGTWDELLAKLKKGEIDLLPAVGYTEARTHIYDFSKNPVYVDSGVLFTSPRMALHTIYDLKGKRVAALRGSTFTKAFIDYVASFGIVCDIVLTDDNAAVMRAISNAEADAGVCIYSLGSELAASFPVVITPISFSPIALEFAVPKGLNGDIIDGIDRLMPAMINDPKSVYGQSFAKWVEPKARARIPAWIWWVMVTIFVLGAILASMALLLRRQVQQKTEYLRVEILEHEKAEENLERSLREKETLLRELYHRTKNTLQLMLSFIHLEALELTPTDEVARLVSKTEERIQAISLVHEMLYKAQDLSRIHIKEYVSELASLILQSYETKNRAIKLELESEDLMIILDTAIPFGLIINELVVNSLKHAFGDRPDGRISIRITRKNETMIMLDYRDDGFGVPEGFDFRNLRTLGIKLIFSIGETQLQGKISFENCDGLRCQLEIPTGLYKARV
jgi:two-component sensor histidine kinase/ABC-type amino acid transport substrate-binding protein